jgi:hypothetical protein
MVEIISHSELRDVVLLAEQICQLHIDYLAITTPAADRIRQGNERALRIGQLLLNLKLNTKHGQYQELLRRNCKIEWRSAQRFCRLFKLNGTLATRNPKWKEEWSMSRALDELVGELCEIDDPDDELDTGEVPSAESDSPDAFESAGGDDLAIPQSANAKHKATSKANQSKAKSLTIKGRTEKRKKPKRSRVSVANLMRPAEKAIGKLRASLDSLNDHERLQQTKEKAQRLQEELSGVLAECDRRLADLQPDASDERKASPSRPKRKHAKVAPDELFADTSSSA